MDIDITFIAQLFVVLLLMVSMRPLVIAPLTQVLDARAEQIGGSRAKTRQLERQANLDRHNYLERLKKARHEVHVVREELRKSGRERAHALEQEMRTKMQQQLLTQRQSVARSEQEALAGLKGRTEQSSRLLLEKLLGRKVPS